MTKKADEGPAQQQSFFGWLFNMDDEEQEQAAPQQPVASIDDLLSGAYKFEKDMPLDMIHPW